MYARTIICLANSRKMSGRCVAGREVIAKGFGNWIRPVSPRSTEELSEEERRYSNGRDPQVLDVIKVPLSGAFPHDYQIENHVIDQDHDWEYQGTANWSEIQNAIENVSGPLWVNGYSSYHGTNDRVPENIAKTLGRSLYLIQPSSLSIVVHTEGADIGKPRRKVRALITHNATQYKLTVTDPMIESRYLAQKDAEYKVDKAILCISLGELYQNYAYKLVAAVITP